MTKLIVNIEIEGSQTYVGNIFCGNQGEGRFQYAPGYLEKNGASAISISLPLQAEPFTEQETRNFFEGLLPEGFTRRSVAQWIHANENDYLSILARLGNECLGAIQIAEEGQERSQDGYELLADEQVARLAKEGATQSAELLVKSHLSLTGASGKVGLYFYPETRKWYLPMGQAPSTHIVKQSHVRLNGIVANEQICLLTAKQLGIEVPDSFIISTGGTEDSDVLFATKRYDRILEKDCSRICDIPRPFRLHQEDFAQALGISSADKYEPYGGEYLKAVFDLLRAYSANPLEDQLKLWDIVIFNYFIGNTDNHIKNLSLLYDKHLKGIRLAPAYDIISTIVYESSTRNMSMSVGGRLDLDEIGRQEFLAEAEKIGMGKKLAMRRFDAMAERFENALSEAARFLDGEGFSQAKALGELILQRKKRMF